MKLNTTPRPLDCGMDIDLYPAKMTEQGLPNYFNLTFESNLSGRLKKKDAYWAAVNTGMQVDCAEANNLRVYYNAKSESHREIRDVLTGRKKPGRTKGLIRASVPRLGGTRNRGLMVV